MQICSLLGEVIIYSLPILVTLFLSTQLQGHMRLGISGRTLESIPHCRFERAGIWEACSQRVTG